MTDQYVQSIDVEVGKAAKYMQWAGIALILASLGFILLSAFYSWWFAFGFVALMSAGGVFLHFYNNTAKAYTYEFSRSRLRIIAGAYDEKRDLLCANKSYDVGVCQIVFRADNQTRRLLFMPDEYMSALVKETLKEQSKDR